MSHIADVIPENSMGEIKTGQTKLIDADKLTTLATQIKQKHKLARQHAQSAIEHALHAGQLLSQAKAQIKHGQWLGFLESTNVNARTAQRYMRLASHQDKLKNDSVSHLNITQALELLSDVPPHPLRSGEYLYQSQLDTEIWIWPYDVDYYHYVIVKDTADNGADISATNRPVKWSGICDQFQTIKDMQTIIGQPTKGFVYREAGYDGELNNGSSFDPGRSYASPHIAEQIQEEQPASFWQGIYTNLKERRDVEVRLTDEAMTQTLSECQTLEQVMVVKNELLGWIGRYHALVAEAQKHLQSEYDGNTSIVELLKRDKPNATDQQILDAIGLTHDLPLSDWLHGASA